MNILRRAFCIVLLSCLSFGMAASQNVVKAGASVPNNTNPSPGSSIERYDTKSGLEEDASAWAVYTDGQGIPTWEVNNVTNPVLSGLALRCAITGGQPYSNVHCYRNLPAEPDSYYFVFSLDFQYRPESTYNNVGGDSVVQGLEFTMNKWIQGQRYEWAVQWENVGTNAPQWRYWNPNLPPDSRWVAQGISGTVSSNEWHTLLIEGQITNGMVEYKRFIFDGQEHTLSIPLIAPAAEPGEVDRLAVAVQLDGNKTETPYDLIIDNVELKTLPSFTDVPPLYWAYDYIERLYSAGITGGCGSGNYCPADPVTRAQMAVFLLKGIHGAGYNPPSVGTETGFSDVPIGYWAAAWIKQLAAEGITSGCGAGIYCPDSSVTRAQMAVFLLKARHGVGFTPPSATGIFTDVPTDFWAANWIERLASEGITSGCATGLYCPDNSVTRDQMAVFLVKAFGLP